MKFIKHTNKELLDHFGLTDKDINHLPGVKHEFESPV